MTIAFHALVLGCDDPQRSRRSLADLLGLEAGGDARDVPFRLDNVAVRVVASPEAERGVHRALLAVEDPADGGHDPVILEIGAPSTLDAVRVADLPVVGDGGEGPRTTGPDPGPAQVSGIDHLVIRSRDVDTTRALYADGLGARVLFDRDFPDWQVRLCMLRVGDAVLEIAGRPGGADGASGGDDGWPHRDRLWGITWRVGDADGARERIAAAGFDVSPVRAGRRPGTRVLTVRDAPCGVPTLLVEPAS